jgi:hypothetical protein
MLLTPFYMTCICYIPFYVSYSYLLYIVAGLVTHMVVLPSFKGSVN